ncbi:DUF1566 domain-containing protein [Leptospira yasudae]|uniref:Lcl C-terminal domain-containing protein n=1 Tax=Leptospira yasudae TaxID=2202201 RepID=UPI001082E627|nr:DUF1566 domain-containing protein [Leptospira yasudae]TGK23135.1 DUF1566 domain-containing protein [Leptospira yasudae]TGM00389.1 DUF1566 domain-containing protein [Leptospira yasudae]
MKSAFLRINARTIQGLSIIASIFFFDCVRAPEKPEAAYSVLQQWIKSNSDTSTSQQEEQSDPCIPTNPTWNPGVLIDSGQTQCWSGAGMLLLPCPGNGHDADFVNVPNPRAFVGPTQNCQYPNDYTTLDTIHGLVWKACAQGQSGADCSTGVPISISWNDAKAGLPGSCSELNASNDGKGYAGRTSWRIPSIRELASLVHYQNAPAIDTIEFPNTASAVFYLSDTVYNPGPTNIIGANFLTANPLLTQAKITNGWLRCVSGASIPAFALTDNGNGTITDNNSGLLWEKCAKGLTGATCTIGTADLSLDWNGARGYCDTLNFAGHTDWRLPNVNELISILDFSAPVAPRIPAVFSNTPVGWLFWTSTTANNPLLPKDRSMSVFFDSLSTSFLDKSSGGYIRCVTNAP